MVFPAGGFLQRRRAVQPGDRHFALITGATSGNGSGDIFIAFSTANPKAAAAKDLFKVEMLPNDALNGIFEGAVQAVEEAIVNAMTGAETMKGDQGHTVYALPHDRVRQLFRPALP